MDKTAEHPHPNPAIIFKTLTAYQQTRALQAAIELDLFSKIGAGAHTADEVAQALGAPTRGVRILCDFLVVSGLLAKDASGYELTADSAMFLDRQSRAYLGSIAKFILNPEMTDAFERLTETVRTGTTTLPDEGTVVPDNPMWVEFAREMAPMMTAAAEDMAGIICGERGDREMKVLDIAAGHGLFGIMIAKRNPQARITALDWERVLAVATENAQEHGVAERHETLPGDAFATEFGGPYDVVTVTNFFHHFDQAKCTELMRKILAALKPGGRCVTLEFVPNEDRVSPPMPAEFAMTMLVTTAAGDAYTFAEYDAMFKAAGYAGSELHALKRSPGSVIVSRKPA
jgi:2-polyprenyl-3-methyl-5-hydroxy-6-metoxy-1,4-benzoquinol methylase